MIDVLEGTIKRRPAMQKLSTMRRSGKNIFRGQLTIGLDLGDRSSAYCILNEAGNDGLFASYQGDWPRFLISRGRYAEALSAAGTRASSDSPHS